MNFEKLALIRILRLKEIKLLMSLDQKLFLRGSHKVIFKALKAYLHKFGKIPSGSILAEAMRTQLSADKAETYIGMLDGFELYDKELPELDEIKKNLEEAYLINTVEQNLEKLVEASKEKDISTVKSLLSSLQTATTMGDKIPENILDVAYEPSKIRIIDCWEESMRANGLSLSALCVVSAGSGKGKSIFALQQALYSFKVDRIPTCVLNLELGETELISRMYSQVTGEDFGEVYGSTDPHMIKKVNDWKQDYFSGDIPFLIKSVRYDAQEIENIIRTCASQGIVLFIIDYLQLVEFSEAGEDWKQLSNLIKLLHNLTLELNCVIFSPIQVNSSDTKIKDGEMLVTPRGSREIEFSSSVFMHLHSTPEEDAEMIVRVFLIKARNAKRATYMLQTNFSQMRFSSTGVVL